MAKLKSISPVSSLTKESVTLNSVLAIIRSLWKTVEAAPEDEKVKLRKEIAQTVNRLKSRIQSRRDKSIAPKTGLLFSEKDVNISAKAQPKDAITSIPRFLIPVLRVYAKDLADQALNYLPKAAQCKSIDELRSYLIANLRFNSLATRRRNANYLINRYFPGDFFNSDFLPFAAATGNTPALGEALFYLTCRAEKIVAMVADEVVFPSLAQGGMSRARIRDFVQAQFPTSKSATQVAGSIFATYQNFGIGSATRTQLNVTLREGSLVAFAYILYLEFPEPGMHRFEQMLDGHMHKWLLWDQAWMIQQLYRLREMGLLSKVSEIDRMRQFTTKYTLVEAIQHIVALGKEPHQ